MGGTGHGFELGYGLGCGGYTMGYGCNGAEVGEGEWDEWDEKIICDGGGVGSV